LEGALDIDPLIHHLEGALGTPRKGELYQHAALFSPSGSRFIHAARALAEPRLLMMEGGQWVWPTVRIGHTVVLDGLRSPGESTQIRTVSQQPAVFEIENFLKPRESDHMIGRGGNVFKSGVSLKDVDKGKQAKEWRTSSQQWLTTDGDTVLYDVDARIQNLTRIPILHAEHIQLLRYDVDEHYSAHHDFFNPFDYARDEGVQAMTQRGASNRLATVFMYLSDVEEGGETNFPRAGGQPGPSDYFDCSMGYSSFPKKNKVIIFYSLKPDGEMDQYSLHGGCDVKKGRKWSANFWLWNKPNDLNQHSGHRAEIARMRGAVAQFGLAQPLYEEPSASTERREL